MSIVLRWIFVPIVMVLIPLQFSFFLFVSSVLIRSSELLALAFSLISLAAAFCVVLVALSVAPIKSRMVTGVVVCGIPAVWSFVPTVVEWLQGLEIMFVLPMMLCAFVGGLLGAYQFEQSAKYA